MIRQLQMNQYLDNEDGIKRELNVNNNINNKKENNINNLPNDEEEYEE